MTPQDDNDVKIYGKPDESADAGDFVELASFLNRQRSNGNIAKAKILGEQLAVIEPLSLPDINIEEFSGETGIQTDIIQQIRVLFVFIVQTALHKILISQLLSSSAVNAMYDKIIESSPAFYDGICDGAAFTFYSLSLRREKDIAKSIGGNFAMLCGKEDNISYKELGSKFYERATKFVEDIISEYHFKDIG